MGRKIFSHFEQRECDKTAAGNGVKGWGSASPDEIDVREFSSGNTAASKICAENRTALSPVAPTNRKLAQEYEARLTQELWRADQLGEEVPRRWEEAVIPWSASKQSKASWPDLRRHLRLLDPYLQGKRLEEIRGEDIDRIKAERQQAGWRPRPRTGRSSLAFGPTDGAEAPLA